MATISNISSKYKELISRSTLQSGGRPKIYQLEPKKEELGTLTTMTVGERNMEKPHKTILLVGETGSGKSSLINALFNHSMGVKWEDEVWFQIMEEGSNQSESQTSDVIVYNIFGCEGHDPPNSLTIIDTPGFGDTRGIERDAIISDRLLDVFRVQGGVRSVHAVGLVMKSSDNRLSDRLLYNFNSVMSLFGKDMERNIVALLTHSDGSPPKNALKALKEAKVKCATNEKNQPTHFLFNNQQKEERTEDNEFILEGLWKLTQRGMDQFTAFLEKTPPQDLEETVKVLHRRVRLTASVQNLQERIQHIELKRKMIQQMQEAVRRHEEEEKKNESYTFTVDEPYKIKEPLPQGWFDFLFYSGATCCTSCKENCHYPGCTVAWSPKSCQVMENGRCTVCSGKCPVSSHVKEKWRYVTKTKKVEKTNKEMKKEFEKNKSAKEEELNLLKDLKADERKMEEEKRRLLDEAYQDVVSLEEIALNVNSVATYIHYDFLIDKMSERGEDEKVQRLEEMKRRVEEGNKSSIGYVWGKMKGLKVAMPRWK